MVVYSTRVRIVFNAIHEPCDFYHDQFFKVFGVLDMHGIYDMASVFRKTSIQFQCYVDFFFSSASSACSA